MNKKDYAGWYVDPTGHKFLITSAINDHGYYVYHPEREYLYTESQIEDVLDKFGWTRRPE